MKRIESRGGAALLAICLLLLGATSGAPAAESAPGEAEGTGARVDINRADLAELAELPGVGPALARRIVEFREEHGPFQRVEDLLKVKGIGEKSFQKLRPAVTVGADTSRK